VPSPPPWHSRAARDPDGSAASAFAPPAFTPKALAPPAFTPNVLALTGLLVITDVMAQCF